MGLFGKIKNIFYDEEIVEVPEQKVKKEEKPKIEEVKIIKKEEPKVEEPSIKPIYTERELFKTENTFKFPILDDEDEEPIKTRSRVNALEMERSKKAEPKESKLDKFSDRFNDRYSTNTSSRREVEKPSTPEKVFKPSPIISPVYGILDDNYTKEELKERQKKYEEPVHHKTSEMNYDSVRRKAYGTLEDELENTLSNIGSKHEEISKTLDEVEKTVEDNNSKSIEDLLNEIEGNRNVSIGEIEELIKDKIEEDEEDKKDIKTFVRKELDEESTREVKSDITSKEDLEDKTLEHDLFNLIDSMYEEKEGE